MAVRNDFAPGEVLLAADVNDTFASKLDLAGGKILQIVRAQDGTNRSTTSGIFVDATISVTITPQKSDSAIILVWTFNSVAGATSVTVAAAIADSSDNVISGAENVEVGSAAAQTIGSLTAIAYATPATTAATTYKGLFRNSGNPGTVTLRNSRCLGQLYAIEVSA